MSESVQSCPSCRTLLLADTVQCPLCRHVVNPDATEELGEKLSEKLNEQLNEELNGGEIVAEREGVECADCGEVVRPELVRCWRCGAFLRPEIAARFQEMQRNPSPVMYSQEGGLGELEDTALRSLQQTSNVSGAVVDEGGFELAEGINMSEGDDFELDDELLKPVGPAEDSESSDKPAEEGTSDEASGSDDESGSSESEGASQPLAASGDALLDIAMRRAPWFWRLFA